MHCGVCSFREDKPPSHIPHVSPSFTSPSPDGRKRATAPRSDKGAPQRDPYDTMPVDGEPAADVRGPGVRVHVCVSGVEMCGSEVSTGGHRGTGHLLDWSQH